MGKSDKITKAITRVPHVDLGVDKKKRKRKSKKTLKGASSQAIPTLKLSGASCEQPTGGPSNEKWVSTQRLIGQLHEFNSAELVHTEEGDDCFFDCMSSLHEEILNMSSNSIDSLSESFKSARSNVSSDSIEDNLKGSELPQKRLRSSTVTELSTVSTAYSKNCIDELMSSSTERPISRSSEDGISEGNRAVNCDSFRHMALRLSYEVSNLSRSLNSLYNASVSAKTSLCDLEMFLTRTTPVLENGEFELKDLWTAFEEPSCFGVDVDVSTEFGEESLTFYPQLSALHIVPKTTGFKSGRGRKSKRREVNYFEVEPPHMRAPCSTMIEKLAAKFPELNNLKSNDLESSSWFSLMWQPVHRNRNPQYGASFLVFYQFDTESDTMLEDQQLSEVENAYRSLFNKTEFLEHNPKFLKVKGCLVYRSPEHYWCISYDRESNQVSDELTRTQLEMFKKRQDDVRQQFEETPSLYHPDYNFILSRPYFA